MSLAATATAYKHALADSTKERTHHSPTTTRRASAVPKRVIRTSSGGSNRGLSS